MKAAIVIDRWKLPIFSRHLKEAGFSYDEVGGSIALDTLTLTVVTDKSQALAQVVLAANTEAAKSGKKS